MSPEERAAVAYADLAGRDLDCPADVAVIAAAIRQAVAAETERCARIADASGDVYNIGTCIAAAIRGTA